MPSSREESLFENEIPEGVYDALIEAVHRHLPAMHRYLALRKKGAAAPGAALLRHLCAHRAGRAARPAVRGGLQARAGGLAPLGETYIQDLRRAFTDGWIDVYENAGKTSGAYSWGVYGVHPYVLLNYEPTLDSLFTIAHELGHSMHTFYSDKNQAFLNSEYPLFPGGGSPPRRTRPSS